MRKSTRFILCNLAVITVAGGLWLYWLYVWPQHNLRKLLSGRTDVRLESMQLAGGGQCVSITGGEVLDYLMTAMRSSEYAGLGGGPVGTSVRSYGATLYLNPGGSWCGTAYVHCNGQGLTFALFTYSFAGDSPSYNVRFPEPVPGSLKEAIDFLVSGARGNVVVGARKGPPDE